MSGNERRGGGVFGRRDRSYHTRRQRLAPTLRFTEMTAVEMLGRVDELTGGRFGSVDAATEGGNRSILEIPDKDTPPREAPMKTRAILLAAVLVAFVTPALAQSPLPTAKPEDV